MLKFLTNFFSNFQLQLFKSFPRKGKGGEFLISLFEKIRVENSIQLLHAWKEERNERYSARCFQECRTRNLRSISWDFRHLDPRNRGGARENRRNLRPFAPKWCQNCRTRWSRSDTSILRGCCRTWRTRARTVSISTSIRPINPKVSGLRLIVSKIGDSSWSSSLPSTVGENPPSTRFIDQPC